MLTWFRNGDLKRSVASRTPGELRYSARVAQLINRWAI
jgi:hypothetical protein